MADAVADALDARHLALIEAGTGTGKTFAYLVPALLAQRRIVVSTGTKNLQDQLFERDLPRLLEALRVGARIAMLKGRANYLCLYRMKRAAHELPLRRAPGGRGDDRLAEVERWSRSTDRGEVSELGRLAEDDRFRFQIT
ncbi:MAG TPA: DEAD/DEAH box helicase, partial [Nevskiaceae bacterium]|nr:DEAD/DEAH box helicase [Nevskiaceae bacterium]